MGKGDQRLKRGKIHRGTFGRLRPKNPKAAAVAPEATKDQTKTKKVTVKTEKPPKAEKPPKIERPVKPVPDDDEEGL